ncbi:MAG TPA: SDR family oxidoreductase [Phycisphaerae bacterium]|nr:SDR family oxidoreductase [Phycisphaerae bacterium]
MAVDWLVTGAGGQLGSVLFRRLLHRGESAVGTLSTGGPGPTSGPTVRLDLTDFGALERLVGQAQPRVIVHTAAVTSVDQAWKAPAVARRTNIDVTSELARLATDMGCRLVFLSTDLVFDGTSAPYAEDADIAPLSVYSQTKAEAEKAVRACPSGLVIRPALMYGVPAVGRPTTFLSQLEALRTGQPLRLFEDEYRTPLWLEDAAAACIEAGRSEITGVLHVAGPERLSRLEMGLAMAQALGVKVNHVVAIRQTELATPEPRPADVSLDCRLYSQLFGHPPGRPMAQALLKITP